MTIRTGFSATAVAVLLLAGCFNLSPSEPSTRFYVLSTDGMTDTAGGPTAQREGMIGLTKLSLSPYLEGLRIVARHGSNRVTFSEFDRWGENLDRGINRTVAAHLSQLLPVRQVEAAPWTAGTRPDVVVSIRVLRFEGHSEAPGNRGTGSAHLLASWEIIDGDTREVVASGTTDHRAPGWRAGDYEQLVELLDEAVLVLARDIAAAVPTF